MKALLAIVIILLTFSSCKKCYECANTNGIATEQCFNSATDMNNYEQSTGDVCAPR